MPRPALERQLLVVDVVLTAEEDQPKDTDESGEESLEALATQRRAGTDTAAIDEDEAVDAFDLPDMDISGEELSVRVVSKQSNEFTCSSCFLVQHRNRLVVRRGNSRSASIACDLGAVQFWACCPHLDVLLSIRGIYFGM